MKRIFLAILAFFMISQLSNAQNQVYNDPIVYVKPNGSNIYDGVGNYFSDAISPSRLMTNIYNGVYSGDVTIRFAGGDYYHTFKFWSVPDTIQSIRIYGGYNPSSRRRGLPDRDFENYETIFHADTTHMVWLEGVGYHNSNGWHTCIVDGITLTSDYHDVNFAAMALVGGDHVVAQCKFEGFYSSDLLVWLETGGNTVTFVNCLFDNNEVKNLMALCTHVNLINVTIADNNFADDMFIPFGSYNQFTQTYSTYYYNLYNSIIYGNSNMCMNHNVTYSNHVGYFDVYNSILEDNEGWINDMANNLIGSMYNPIFNTYSAAPYSCDPNNSPAIAAGDASHITLCPHYSALTEELMDYDVANNDRYWDYSPSTIVDMGAYQNGYDDGSANYYSVNPSRIRRRTSHKEPETISLWANGQMLYIKEIQEEGLNLNLYNIMGQIVYTTELQIGKNAISLPLALGIYVAKISSNDGKDIISKPISLQ